jgi:hypothetical protein
LSFGVIGAPGQGWAVQTIGNYTNSGSADILFANKATGEFATWDLSDRAIVGGGNIGAPGSNFTAV